MKLRHTLLLSAIAAAAALPARASTLGMRYAGVSAEYYAMQSDDAPDWDSAYGFALGVRSPLLDHVDGYAALRVDYFSYDDNGEDATSDGDMRRHYGSLEGRFDIHLGKEYIFNPFVGVGAVYIHANERTGSLNTERDGKGALLLGGGLEINFCESVSLLGQCFFQTKAGEIADEQIHAYGALNAWLESGVLASVFCRYAADAEDLTAGIAFHGAF